MGRKRHTTEEFIEKLDGDYTYISGVYETKKSKILIKHDKCNNEYEASWDGYVNGKSRCPFCSGKMKKTTTQFKKEMHEIYGDEYIVLGEYINNKTPIEISHSVCDNTWQPSPVDILSKNTSCPICSRQNVGKLLSKGTEKFKEDVREMYGDEYTVLGEYNNNKTPILIRHGCGNEYEAIPDKFVNGGFKCETCYDVYNKSLTTDEFKEIVNNITKCEYEVIGEYKNTKTPIMVKHKKCNKELPVYPNQFISGKGYCSFCSKKKKKTHEEFLEELSVHSDIKEYEFLEEYQTTFGKIKVRHKTCGLVYDITPQYMVNGYQRCPKCFNNRSQGEVQIEEFIKSIYDGEILTSDRNVLSCGKELDIYVPDKKLAIEFNGLYWHSKERYHNDYHYNKSLECKDKGIQLLQIYDIEWAEKQDIVKNKIAYLLRSSDIRRIYARKCNIISITDKAIKKEFLEINHIQGNDKASHILGLEYEGELIAMMTFGKGLAVRGKDTLELSRYATKLNHSITGGFQRLLKYFIKNRPQEYINNESITSFADIRYSYGDVYEKNNWQRISVTKPSYKYFYNGKLYHKSSFKKSNIEKRFPEIYDSNKTEKEMMNELGIPRVYDCGLIKFEYPIDKV